MFGKTGPKEIHILTNSLFLPTQLPKKENKNHSKFQKREATAAYWLYRNFYVKPFFINGL